jgi:hypothetical protein
MSYPNYPPGIQSPRTASHRALFLQRSETFLAQGRTLSGQCSRDPGNTSDVDKLRAGLLLGKITTVVNSLGTVGYFAPSVLGVTTNAEAIGATTIEAAAGVVTELLRRCGTTGTFILTGPPTANGVVQSETVTYSAASGTAITVTAIANAYVAGSFIQPTDGSQTPLTLIPDWDYPIKVTDPDGTSLSAVDFPKVPVSGIIDGDQLLPSPTDTSLRTWIANRLNDSLGGQFVIEGGWRL